jgi:hypothetical protein
MVHALREIWRVLVPGGLLLDLRPFCASWPVEVVIGERVVRVGVVDDTLALTDDLAANRSIALAASDGWYTRERDDSFGYDWYWDSVEEMKTHVEERWSPITIPDLAYRRAERLMATDGARVRVRLHMIIARYRKEMGHPEI